MSDFINRRDAGDREPIDKSLLGAKWSDEDSSGSVGLPPQPRWFEGASSMLEPGNPQAEEDRARALASEQNLRTLLKDVEKLRKARQVPLQAPVAPESSYVDRFLERARAQYAKQDFRASLEILHDGLKLEPGNAEILALVEEVRKAAELRQVQMEESGLADRIAQCKKEAVELFEKGRYGDCIERFKVLSELDPTNSDLRHYLEVSCEQAAKAESSQAMPAATEPVEPQRAEISSRDSEGPEGVDPAPRKDEAAIVSTVATTPADPGVAMLHSRRLFETIEPHSAGGHAPESTQTEYPAAVQHRGLSEEVTESSEPAAPVDPEWTEDSVEEGTKKFKVACLAGAGLVIGAMLGAWLALAPARLSTVPVESASPDTSAGSTDSSQTPADSAGSETQDPQGHAQRAFRQGRLLEANRICETILQSTPDNPFALDLKEQIRGRYLKTATQASAKQNWAEASMAWHNLLKVFPGDRDAARQLKSAKANLKQEEQLALAGRVESERQIEELRRQIGMAMSSGRYLPPSSGNAFELVEKLEGLTPGDEFARNQRDEILRQLSGFANRALQAKDSVAAGALVRQIESYFPQASELKTLRDGLKAEQARLADVRSAWLQKAEAAMAAGHFVMPASDNVVAYCSQLLAVDPQNVKAHELKKASASRASAQAKAWIQEGKYDEAREVYSALLYLPQADNQGGLTSQELKGEVEKLTFNAHAVVHDHTLGSCTGRLRFNGYQLTYVPSSDSKDGFSVKMAEVSRVESDDKLKLHLKGKTYRFRINGLKDPQEIRTRISNIQKHINALVASR